MSKLTRNLELAKFDAVFSAGVLARKGRPTHTKGVAGAGTFVVTASPTFPANTFFRPGRTFDAVIRHGNVAYDDDASMDIRGAALRLVDPDDPTRPALDLLMNTGEVAFSSANVFLDFALASAPRAGTEGPVDVKGLERFLRSSVDVRRQFEAGLRRAPRSFARLHYHTQIAFRLHANDGRERYARFRLVHASGKPEQGIPSPTDLATPWLQDRHIGEVRDFAYLRDELRQRIAHDAATYRLEVQIYEPLGALDPMMLNPGRAWDEAAIPFREVGVVSLRKALGAKKTEELAYNVAHLPEPLTLLECESLDDFGSIGFVRAHVYAVTQQLRRIVARVRRLGELRHQNKKRKFRSRKHQTREDKRRDSSLLHLVLGHVWRG